MAQHTLLYPPLLGAVLAMMACRVLATSHLQQLARLEMTVTAACRGHPHHHHHQPERDQHLCSDLAVPSFVHWDCFQSHLSSPILRVVPACGGERVDCSGKPTARMARQTGHHPLVLTCLLLLQQLSQM